jgi:hypothetical protein
VSQCLHPENRIVSRNIALLQMEKDINKLVSTNVKNIPFRQGVKRHHNNKQLSHSTVFLDSSKEILVTPYDIFPCFSSKENPYSWS